MTDTHDIDPAEIPPELMSGFNSLYGLELTRISPDEMRGRVPFSPAVLQPFGIVHGGVFCSIAETLASVGTGIAVHESGLVSMGLANQTSFLRPIDSGDIEAVARPVHRGRSTWVWNVEILDSQDRLCAISTMTIAVREPREPVQAD